MRLAITIGILVALGAWLIHVASTLDWSDDSSGEAVLLASQVFNLVEGLIWLTVGLVVLWRSRPLHKPLRPGPCAGISFLLFGFTDFVEIRTGSWFEPPWLLALNVTCVVSLALCLAWYSSIRKNRAGSDVDE